MGKFIVLPKGHFGVEHSTLCRALVEVTVDLCWKAMIENADAVL